MNTFIGLLIALLTISAALAPTVKKYFENKAPELEFSYLKWDLKEGPSFTVVNSSSFSGYVEYLYFTITVDTLTLHTFMSVDNNGSGFLDVPPKSIKVAKFEKYYSMYFTTQNSQSNLILQKGLGKQPKVLNEFKEGFEALISPRFRKIKISDSFEKVEAGLYKTGDMTISFGMSYRSFAGIHSEYEILIDDEPLYVYEFLKNMGNQATSRVRGLIQRSIMSGN